MRRLVCFALLAIFGCAAVSPARAADLTFPDRRQAAFVDVTHVLSSGAPILKPARLVD